MILIEQDRQEINDLIQKLLSLNVQESQPIDELLYFLEELQDIVQLYWYVKQQTIYVHCNPNSHIEVIEFSENHFHITLRLRRCIHSMQYHQLIKGFVQFKQILSLLVAQLDKEQHYLQRILPSYFSVSELAVMADYYQQCKLSWVYESLASDNMMPFRHTHLSDDVVPVIIKSGVIEGLNGSQS